MKKFFSLMLLLATIAIGCQSCSSDNSEPQPEPQEVSVKLDYTLFESGDMSRSGENAYQHFFDNHIKNKELTPKNVYLVFNLMPDEAFKQSVDGVWGEIIQLREGEYKVGGNSYPDNYNSSEAVRKYVSDEAYLTFDETVSITKTSTEVKLKAKYDCYLLMFDKTNIKSLTYNFQRTNMNAPSVDNVYYMFVYKDTDSYEKLYVEIEKTDGTAIRLCIAGNGFEKGKYYFFDSMTNSFDIDPMQNGNQ